MDISNQLRDLLAQNQQMMRQKDLFGDIMYSVTTIKPSDQELNSIQELLIKFSNDPVSNIDSVMKVAEFLQFIPSDFVDKLLNYNFFNTLTKLLPNLQYAYKAFYIISGAITPISNFTSSILQNISCNNYDLFSSYIKDKMFPPIHRQRNLTFLEIIEEFLSYLVNYDRDPQILECLHNTIIAIEECTNHILSIQTKQMKLKLKYWGISAAVCKRVFIDTVYPDIFHKGIKLLLQIAEIPEINSYSVISQSEKMILIENYSEDILCDLILLFSKIICSHLCGLTRAQAKKNLIEKLISFLSGESYKVKINTINLIFQLSRGSLEPIMMLIDNGLYQHLLNFAKEYPDDADQVLNVAYSICNCGKDFVNSICESGFIDLIHYAIGNGSISVQRSAIYLVSNIMYRGSFEEIRQVIDPHILEKMIEFLEEDCIGVECIFRGLIHGLDNEYEACDDSLLKALSNQEFFSLLQNYAQSDDQNICELAMILQQKLTSS